MVAIGRPGERLGAGRLPSTDKAWRKLARMLMRQAKFILIIPGLSEGVSWEINFISAWYTAKTIYIMPPAKFFKGKNEALREDWEKMKWRHFGRSKSFPPYDEKGALFRVDRNGEVTDALPFATRFGNTQIRHLIPALGR